MTASFTNRCSKSAHADIISIIEMNLGIDLIPSRRTVGRHKTWNTTGSILSLSPRCTVFARIPATSCLCDKNGGGR
jgi:hypothetical protein